VFRAGEMSARRRTRILRPAIEMPAQGIEAL
jgi:hypothetical protein